MTIISSITALMLSCSLLLAADVDLQGGDGTAYVLKIPEGVTAKVNHPPAGMPQTVKINSANKKMGLQLTFMPAGMMELKTQEDVNGLVRKVGAGQYESGSVEKTTNVEVLPLKVGFGALARYTDVELVDIVNPRPDQFKVVATGVLSLNGNIVTVTLLGDAFDSPDFLAGLALLETGLSKK